MDEVRTGDMLLAFDGRILEVFGFGSQDSYRFHVQNMELWVDEPDRKGRRTVKLRVPSGLTIQFDAPDEDWPGVGPFFERVHAALGASSA